MASHRNPSHLALAPFPAFNPLNWGALTPAASLSSTLLMWRIGADAWRAYFEATRALTRMQQDAWLETAQHAFSAFEDASEQIAAEQKTNSTDAKAHRAH